MKDLSKLGQDEVQLDLEMRSRMRAKIMLDNSIYILRECLVQYMCVVQNNSDAQITDAMLDIDNLIKRNTGKTIREIITT